MNKMIAFANFDKTPKSFELNFDKTKALSVFFPLIKSSLFFIEFPIPDTETVERLKNYLNEYEKQFSVSNDYKTDEYDSMDKLFSKYNELEKIYNEVINEPTFQLTMEELLDGFDYSINKSIIYRTDMSDKCTRLIKAIFQKAIEENC